MALNNDTIRTAAKALLALIDAGKHKSFGDDGKTGDLGWNLAVVNLRSAVDDHPIATAAHVHAVPVVRRADLHAALCCNRLIGPNTKTSSEYERITCEDR